MKKQPSKLPRRLTVRLKDELFARLQPAADRERERLGLSELSLNTWCIKVLEDATRLDIAPVVDPLIVKELLKTKLPEQITQNDIDAFTQRKQETLYQLAVLANVAERLTDPNACAVCGALPAPYEVDGKRFCSKHA